MDEETLAVAELESLRRMAAQSKTGAVMNSPEKHKWGKNRSLNNNIVEEDQKTLSENRWTAPFLHI